MAALSGIINGFKNNRDDIYGFSSFAGLIVTLAALGYSIYKSNWAVEFVYVVSILSLTSLFFGILCIWAIRKYDKVLGQQELVRQEKQIILNDMDGLKRCLASREIENKKIATTFHNILHESRMLINSLYSSLVLEGPVLEDVFPKKNSEFQMFFMFFLTNIKEIFDIVTGDICSVCIKLLTPDQGVGRDVLVETFMRDSISFRERSEIDKSVKHYPYHENTAFKRILSKTYAKSYFISNNLSLEEGYINLNPNWKKFYNACLVVPIRIPSNENEYIVIGFICVDNNKGGFDEKKCFDILASLADHLFYVFRIYNDLKVKCDSLH